MRKGGRVIIAEIVQNRALFDVFRYREQGLDYQLDDVPSDMHDGFEILHVCDGSGHLVINERLYKLKPKSIFFYNGHRFHYTNPYKQKQYVRSGVRLREDSFTQLVTLLGYTEILEPFFEDGSRLVCIELSDETHRKIDSLFQRIHEELQDDRAGRNLAIAGCILNIMAFAFREADDSTDSMELAKPPYSHIVHVMQYISRNLQDFQLDALAEEIDLSKYYLCHIFKRVTGLTIQRYLLKRRMESAQMLLSTTNTPIASIAEVLGFGSFSVFSRNFHRVMGCTPRHYRKLYQQGGDPHSSRLQAAQL